MFGTQKALTQKQKVEIERQGASSNDNNIRITFYVLK